MAQGQSFGSGVSAMSTSLPWVHPEGVQVPVKFTERFEGEGFNVEKSTGGEVITRAFLSYDWSARNHLLWREIQKGDELVAVFYSEKERKGRLSCIYPSSRLCGCRCLAQWRNDLRKPGFVQQRTCP